jgi:hypothetical protein
MKFELALSSFLMLAATAAAAAEESSSTSSLYNKFQNKSGGIRLALKPVDTASFYNHPKAAGLKRRLDDKIEVHGGSSTEYHDINICNLSVDIQDLKLYVFSRSSNDEDNCHQPELIYLIGVEEPRFMSLSVFPFLFPFMSLLCTSGFLKRAMPCIWRPFPSLRALKRVSRKETICAFMPAITTCLLESVNRL